MKVKKKSKNLYAKTGRKSGPLDLVLSPWARYLSGASVCYGYASYLIRLLAQVSQGETR